MAEQLTYLVTPNFTFRPYVGPIRLGSLIADPTRPHRVLTSVDAETLATKYPRVESVPAYNHEVLRGTKSSVSAAVWARFLQTVSASISGENSKENIRNCTMDELLTEYFVEDPAEEEIQARIAEPKVRTVMKAQGFLGGKPVYMINGIKIAKKLVVKQEGARSISGVLEQVDLLQHLSVMWRLELSLKGVVKQLGTTRRI